MIRLLLQALRDSGVDPGFFRLAESLTFRTLMGLTKTGAMVIPVGAESGTDRIFSMAKFFKPTVFFGTPSLATYIIEKAPEKIGMDAKSLGIKLLACGGEPGAGVPEWRKRIEESFGAKLLDTGAGHGVSCDHPEYQGMHWLGDDLCIYELVDQDTREPIPLEDGARGEAVFTNIEGDGWSWLRTSLGDIHEVTMSPCPCGRTGFRFHVIGRTDDMIKVKGVNVFPAAVKGIIQDFAPATTGEMRIVLPHPGPSFGENITIKVEAGAGLKPEDQDAMTKKIRGTIREKLVFTPRIVWVPADTFEKSQYKVEYFERNY